MDYIKKLIEFPTVNVINLEESSDRRKFMIDQFDKYGIRYKIHTKPRYVTFKDKVNVEIVSPTKWLPDLQIGALTSFIEAMKDWYFNTKEEYAIFCEDDISFESIEHWNFTWPEFIAKIPPEVEKVQLVRMTADLKPGESIQAFELNLRWGRWWGATFMFTRGEVFKLLNILNPSQGHYRLVSEDGNWEPCIENCLFLNYSKICNFPLLFEDNINLDPVDGKSICSTIESKLISNYLIRHLWRTMGSSLDLNEAMRIS